MTGKTNSTNSSTSSSKGGSKTSFVLSFPKETPAAEVVSKGKLQGITLTDKYVYTVRSKYRDKAPKAKSTDTVKAVASTAAAKAPVAKPAQKAPVVKPAAKMVAPKSAPAKATPVKPAPVMTHKSESVEGRFVDLALDVGLARAEALLGQLRAKVRSIVL